MILPTCTSNQAQLHITFNVCAYALQFHQRCCDGGFQRQDSNLLLVSNRYSAHPYHRWEVHRAIIQGHNFLQGNFLGREAMAPRIQLSSGKLKTKLYVGVSGDHFMERSDPPQDAFWLSRLLMEEGTFLSQQSSERSKNKCTGFFCLKAAWLNEGRCPGGRPSVSAKE